MSILGGTPHTYIRCEIETQAALRIYANKNSCPLWYLCLGADLTRWMPSQWLRKLREDSFPALVFTSRDWAARLTQFRHEPPSHLSSSRSPPRPRLGTRGWDPDSGSAFVPATLEMLLVQLISWACIWWDGRHWLWARAWSHQSRQQTVLGISTCSAVQQVSGGDTGES